MATTLSDLAARYLVGVPASSRPACRRYLDGWLAWCADMGVDPMRARRHHIEAYTALMREARGKSASWAAHMLSAVCGLYRYALEENLIADDPGAHVRRPVSRHRSQGTWLTVDEARDFLALAEADRRRWVGAACCLMLLSGLRVGETIRLDVTDLHARAGLHTVHVRRKFDWMQELAIADRTLASLQRAIGTRRTGPMLTHDGRRLTEQRILGAVTGLAGQAGIEARITPHSLRRTFATIGRAQGVPDRKLMASGGWASREMLDYYDMGRLSVTDNATHAIAAALE